MTCSGSLVIPLVYVEVQPLFNRNYTVQDESECNLSAAFVKQQLTKLSIQSSFGSEESIIRIFWEDHFDKPATSLDCCLLYQKYTGDNNQHIIYFESCHPNFRKELYPCLCRAYTIIPRGSNQQKLVPINFTAIVTNSTTVRIISVPENSDVIINSEITRISVSNMDSILDSQNIEVVKELTMRVQKLLARDVTIGTTYDAKRMVLERKKRNSIMKQGLRNCFDAVKDNKKVSKVETGGSKPIYSEGALLVHSPNNGSGKSALVKCILQKSCDVAYTIDPGALVAKYGIHADDAIETIIHEIVLSAAVKGQSVGILLDNLEAFLPPILYGRFDLVGDASTPVLNGCKVYLRNLTTQLTTNGEIPFPMKNPMYNLGGSHGCLLPVHLCLIAVVTCPDDGYKSEIRRKSSLRNEDRHSTIFDALVVGRYRLPDLSAETRLRCFHRVFHDETIVLAPDLQHQLPALAASTVWVRGAIFQLIAKKLRQRLGDSIIATYDAFLSVLSETSQLHNSGSLVQFSSETSPAAKEGLFSFVGGNDEAKIAIKDCLGIEYDLKKSKLLKALTSPSGILLYGPPGTGKTLIAKGVSQLLRSKDPSREGIGGAFISIKSTDVARAEVGTGEKMLSNAFQIARSNAPSVVFIDEFQALFTDRSNGGSGRLSTTLFQCMDNLKRWQEIDKAAILDGPNVQLEQDSGKKVFVLAATNTPWMIDKAFLRPGRFDRLIHVGLPCEADRYSILQLHIEKMKTSFGNDTEKVRNLCERLASLTPQYSGADLANLCRSAAVQCITTGAESLDEHHFIDTLATDATSSTNNALVERIKQWRP